MKRPWLALVLVLLVSCSGDEPDPPAATTVEPTPTKTAAATPTKRPKIPSLRLKRVATLTAPTAMAVRGDDIFIAEKTGRVRALGGRLVLDISNNVSGGYEQGLLGLAFAPDGAHLYVDYTDPNGDTRVVEYAYRAGRAVPSSRRQLLFVDQPYANHNGGMIAFGPDGFLYIAMGDGGSQGDPDGNGQSLRVLLGKILRIDVGGRPYRVPDDNPFVGRDGGQGEIWAYGLRNPWRFTFDRETGDLWIGDVGASGYEEIDVERAGTGGVNYGWDRFEGRHDAERPAPEEHRFPIYEYATGGPNCAVTGGYVYRGSIAGLVGRYVFADFCAGEIFALTRVSGDVRVKSLGISADQLSSFGEDADGEVYVLSLAGPVYRIVAA